MNRPHFLRFAERPRGIDPHKEVAGDLARRRLSAIIILISLGARLRTMKCISRIGGTRLPSGDWLLVCVTLAFATYGAYEFELLSPLLQASQGRKRISLDEALLLTTLFSLGLLYLSWRFYCLQRGEALRRRAWERRAMQAAERDGLTALPNRRRFQRALEDALAHGLHSDVMHAVLLLDLKDFKRINDNHGHAAGDEVLIRVARRLRSEYRGLMLSRLGSDEFGLLATNLRSAEEATSIAFRLIKAVHRPMLIRENWHELDVRAGIALFPQDGRDPTELLRKAELALNRAESAQGPAPRFFEPEMDTSVREHALLERDLRAAIGTDAVQPFYQPIIDLASRRLIGFEALARWTHPSLGPVPPERFIAVAERCGLMEALSEHLLRYAVRAALSWPGHLQLAFNISPAQLSSRTWPLHILFILQEAGISPQRLELEVTETALIQDLDNARKALDVLRGGGLRIALDDFGTGASSLHHLREFRVDTIKIDRRFIADITYKPDSAALIRGVIGLAHGLGLAVTAEGVERPEQAAALRELRCDRAQGYLYAAALAADEAAALTRREHLE